MEESGIYAIRAKKEHALRIIFSAGRALVVVLYPQEGYKKIKVGQGSWNQNIISNLAYFFSNWRY